MEMRLSELVRDPKNRRKHNPRNLGMITEALGTVGAARSIVIDEGGTILAGNGVAEAATNRGMERVLVVDTDGDTIVAVRRSGLTEDQKRALAIYDNRTGELATWDARQLKEDAEAGLSLQPFWAEQEAQALLVAAAKGAEGRTNPEHVPTARPTDIAPGDLFQLGRHRLLCGDSTKCDDVARLLGGAVPTLMVTDPPYGVNYDPTWRMKAGVSKNARKMGRVANEDRADWTEAWRLFPGAVCYVWHASLQSDVVKASLEMAGFGIRSQIIWAKDRMALSRGDYHWQHEPCWYAVRDGATGGRTPDRSQSTLWNIPSRDDSGHGHGTQKPVECMARPMRNHLAVEVYEPFCGSGTTLIAAETLGRTCFAVEISPEYVQVAIDRWEAFTGHAAEKICDASHVGQ